MQTPLTGIVAQHSLRVAVAEVMAVEDVTEGVPTAVSAILHRKLPQASSPSRTDRAPSGRGGLRADGPGRCHPLSRPANSALRSGLRAARPALWRVGLHASAAQRRRPSARCGAGRARHAAQGQPAAGHRGPALWADAGLLSLCGRGDGRGTDEQSIGIYSTACPTPSACWRFWALTSWAIT